MNLAQNNKIVKILLTGGGTGGPVTPLLAVVDELKEAKLPIGSLASGVKFIWLGTKNGPEKLMVESEGIRFMAINSGKLRRYFSWRNIIDPFFILIGFIEALFILKRERPDIMLSAGGFVSVPVAWAAWFSRVPIIIHQMDARSGLANKLMAPFAKTITVALESSLDNYGAKAEWIGSPIRSQIKKLSINKAAAIQKLGLNDKKPIVLIMGGGTGSRSINDLVLKSRNDLLKICQIIHLTGKRKDSGTKEYPSGYHSFEFMLVDGMAKAFVAADVVVSRCGMGVLTELSELGKSSILIPMPDTHQEDNAAVFVKKEAAVVLSEKYLTPEKLYDNIKEMLNNKELRIKLSKNIGGVIKKGAGERMVEIVSETLSTKF